MRESRGSDMLNSSSSNQGLTLNPVSPSDEKTKYRSKPRQDRGTKYVHCVKHYTTPMTCQTENPSAELRIPDDWVTASQADFQEMGL